MIRVLICLWCISVGLTAVGQSTYRVGIGAASIEPDNSIFSTALAGYGLPREGRFSVGWEEVTVPASLYSLSGAGSVLLALSETDLWEGHIDEKGDPVWSKAGGNPGYRTVASVNGDRYAIDDEGAMFGVGKAKRKGRKTQTGVALTTVIAGGKSVYGVDRGGRIRVGESIHSTGWRISVASAVEVVESLATDGAHLYALNRGDSLFMAKLGEEELQWTMIGRRNDVTFTIDPVVIASAGQRLYALTSEGKLFRNVHVTDGNLSAQAVVVEEGDRRVVIVVADVCGFEYPFIQSIKERIASEHGVPPDAVLINATHTHFAPITQDFGPMGPFYREPNSRYMEIVRDGVLMAVREAMTSRQPMEIYFGRGTTSIGMNRRAAAIDVPPYDSTLDVITFRASGEQFVLFSAACHPVFRNAGIESFTLSANYPAVARNELVAAGQIGQAIFMQGCGGDINPADTDHRVTGKKLALSVEEVMRAPQEKIGGPLSWSLDTILIPVPMWSREEVVAYREDALKRIEELEAARDVRWADAMLALYEKDSIPDALAVYVQTIDIGDWRLVGLSREVVNEYGPAIRALWPDRHVTVAGYCNDVTSYLPNDWHIKTGVYEGKGSFFWYGAHGPFPEGTFDTIIRTIRERHTED